jgi:amidase
MSAVPTGLIETFWAYEHALMENDLGAMDRLFAAGAETLRGDPGGLLVGHDEIRAFRSARGGAPARDVVDVHVQVLAEDAALIVAVIAPRKGGRGLQTQVWRRTDGNWQVSAAHVSPPPATFDSSVWRVVGNPLLAGSGTGPLVGETLAVKDVFAVAGFAVGAGVPAYLAEQSAATEHSPAVARLLAAGASIRGIAQTDQFAYSLAGDNPHYGTPVNAVVAAALPGGSSNGPATAVALGEATIGLGTDTAGSIRVPASYQGLWGLRTACSPPLWSWCRKAPSPFRAP